MRKRIFLVIISIFLFSVFVSAVSYNETYQTYSDLDASSLQVESLKYDPYPVNPGEYFTLWVIVKKTGSDTKGATFVLNPEYPFSLDSNEDAERTFASMMGESALLQYKVRVDDDAVEGTNILELKYKLDGSSGWITKKFSISVSDAQTSFDGVIQDMEDDTVSLALANVGKNVANSVIVRIPEQDGYQATGVTGQMVGNLENGDYTIVSFEVAKKNRDASSIIFQIDYTDEIGIRRTVYLEQSVSTGETVASLEGQSGFVPGDFQNRSFGPGMKQKSSDAWKYAVGIIILITISYFLFVKYSKHKKMSLMKKVSSGKDNK